MSNRFESTWGNMEDGILWPSLYLAGTGMRCMSVMEQIKCAECSVCVNNVLMHKLVQLVYIIWQLPCLPCRWPKMWHCCENLSLHQLRKVVLGVLLTAFKFCTTPMPLANEILKHAWEFIISIYIVWYILPI